MLEKGLLTMAGAFIEISVLVFGSIVLYSAAEIG